MTSRPGPCRLGCPAARNPPAVGCDDTGPRLDRWRPMLVTVWGGADPVTMLPAVIAPSGWAGAGGLRQRHGPHPPTARPAGAGLVRIGMSLFSPPRNSNRPRPGQP